MRSRFAARYQTLMVRSPPKAGVSNHAVRGRSATSSVICDRLARKRERERSARTAIRLIPSRSSPREVGGGCSNSAQPRCFFLPFFFPEAPGHSVTDGAYLASSDLPPYFFFFLPKSCAPDFPPWG